MIFSFVSSSSSSFLSSLTWLAPHPPRSIGLVRKKTKKTSSLSKSTTLNPMKLQALDQTDDHHRFSLFFPPFPRYIYSLAKRISSSPPFSLPIFPPARLWVIESLLFGGVFFFFFFFFSLSWFSSWFFFLFLFYPSLRALIPLPLPFFLFNIYLLSPIPTNELYAPTHIGRHDI